jgi:hypothetical protein
VNCAWQSGRAEPPIYREYGPPNYDTERRQLLAV